MVTTSNDIIERFRVRYGKDIDLTLRPAYRDLLHKLGNPQNSLPPVFHIAGTNGKGSTCAFLRAILESAGHKVHVYTSPHLVSVHERIRIAGRLIDEQQLVLLLSEIERMAVPGTISYFEATTAAAFLAFSRNVADFTILETGLGGRLDATNVVSKPAATIITRLSFDHREYLGDTLDKIAREKAGILRADVPCFSACQPDALATEALREAAEQTNAPLYVGGKDWIVKDIPTGFYFEDKCRSASLPRPALLGQHQYQNAGLAIAALSVIDPPLAYDAIAHGLGVVEWPARLQRITKGPLTDLAPNRSEIWLDGGHNDSAGEVLATQIDRWRDEDGAEQRPLYIVFGMLVTKHPDEFLRPFADRIAQLRTVPISGEPSLGYPPEELANAAQGIGITSARACQSPGDAIADLNKQKTAIPPRILICGSLYLAGEVLKEGNR